MIVHKYIKDKRNKMNLLFVDLSNQNVEQTASTMSASTNGHLEILKNMSIVLQEHTQHSSKNYILFSKQKAHCS